MTFKINHFFGFFGLVFGGFTGLVGFDIPAALAAQTNPCPKIYYEEPYNSRLLLAATCPPNAVTQLVYGQRQVPVLVPGSVPTTIIQPIPSPVEPAPIGTVQLQGNRVNVKLKNMTNTQITYQAIGDTTQRILEAKTDFVLKDLLAPITITLLRSDSGLIRVTMVANSGAGELVLMLDEATGLSDSQASVRIQGNGNVLAY
jgi:hypothetical protein